MPRKLNYPIRRMIALSNETDLQLARIAGKRKIKPAEQARAYIEHGIETEDTKKEAGR